MMITYYLSLHHFTIEFGNGVIDFNNLAYDFNRDIDNRGVETYSSCKMYANVDTDALLEYLNNSIEYPDHEFKLPFNETSSKYCGFIFRSSTIFRTQLSIFSLFLWI